MWSWAPTIPTTWGWSTRSISSGAHQDCLPRRKARSWAGTPPGCSSSADAHEIHADLPVLADDIHAEALQHHLAVFRSHGDIVEIFIALTGDQHQKQRLLLADIGEIAAYP